MCSPSSRLVRSLNAGAYKFVPRDTCRQLFLIEFRGSEAHFIRFSIMLAHCSHKCPTVAHNNVCSGLVVYLGTIVHYNHRRATGEVRLEDAAATRYFGLNVGLFVFLNTKLAATYTLLLFSFDLEVFSV